MLFLDDMRMKFDEKTDFFKTHYKSLERKKWYCANCDDIIKGKEEDLIYLGECDVVFHIHNLENGEMYPAHKMLNNQECTINPCIMAPSIPQLSKLIKNIFIKSDGQTAKIKARDSFKCQLCGFDNDMALATHKRLEREVEEEER